MGDNWRSVSLMRGNVISGIDRGDDFCAPPVSHRVDICCSSTTSEQERTQKEPLKRNVFHDRRAHVWYLILAIESSLSRTVGSCRMSVATSATGSSGGVSNCPNTRVDAPANATKKRGGMSTANRRAEFNDATGSAIWVRLVMVFALL